jgi:hypothetical protein
MVTYEQLRELLHYDPDTGAFTWRKRDNARPCWNSRYTKGRAGTISETTGYVVINTGKRLYRAHRLAWLYVYGRWPRLQIDHRNGDRTDNRITNLREASQTENNANASVRTDNRCGFKGVRINPISGRYRARIRINGKAKHLGYFDSPEEAHSAYCAAAQEVFGEFARPI